jgi:arylsulfatase A
MTQKNIFWYLIIAFVVVPLTSCRNKAQATRPVERPVSLTGNAGTQKPNIVFVLADDLGWGELGCYGNLFNETPHLDKLASQGIKFTHAYAAAPVCSPTRASILTGQYPARVGITDFLAPQTGRLLDPGLHTTINEVLGQAGYHTGLIGKWHLDTDFTENRGGPQKHGFDEVIGTETKYIADGDYFFPYDKISTFSAGADREYLTDRQSEEAAAFINRNKSKQFFLFLSYYSVHTRLSATEPLINKYKRKFDARYGEGQAEKTFDGKNVRHQADHRDNPYLAAMLESIDQGVGKIMATLEQNGLAENTLLVFFSDNGGANSVGNNGGLRMHKTWLYEGGIRSPLIMRFPGSIKAGTMTDVPVSSQDLYPTFADLAKVRTSDGHKVDGVSLLPLITKAVVPEREALFWHYPSETGKWKNRMSSAVRKGDYKLIYFYADKREELFNLKADPAEQHDLSKEMPEKVTELRGLLDSWKKTVRAEQPAI